MATLDELEEEYNQLVQRRKEGLPPMIMEDVEPWKEWQSPESDASAYERAPRDLSWGEAYRIQTGEEEKPTRVTPTGYLKEKLMYVPGLVARAGRALESGPTFIDEAGNVVRSGGRPVQTVEESAGAASEIAGFGVGLAQGPGIIRSLYKNFRNQYKRDPTPVEVQKIVETWDEVPNDVRQFLDKLGVERKREQFTDVPPEVRTGLDRLRTERNAANIAAAEAEKVRIEKIRAERPPPRDIPGPRSTLPRQAMLPAGEPEAVLQSMIRERRGLSEPPGPTRVIEAPAIPEEQAARLRERLASGEKVNIRELLHQDLPRVVMDPAMRDLETGQVRIGPRERSPDRGGPPPAREVTGTRTDEITLPKDTVIGPSRAERMAGRGWTREVPDTPDEPTFVLRDSNGVTKAELIEIDAVDDSSGRSVWKAVGKDDADLGLYKSPEEAAEALKQQFPDVKPRFYPPIAGGADGPDFKPSVDPYVFAAGRDPLPPAGKRPPIPPIDPPIKGMYPVPSPDPVEPYAVIKRVGGRYREAWETGAAKLNPVIAQFKSGAGFSSPTDIAKAYPAFGDLMWVTKQARRDIEHNVNTLFTQRKTLTDAVGPDEFSRLMRLKDENKVLNTTPEIAKMADDLYDTIQTYVGELPTNTTLKGGFEKHLKQAYELRGVKAIDVPEYTSADVNRIAPITRETKLKERLASDEPYTVDSVDRMIRAAGRKQVMGTALNKGYMQDIKPYLAQLADAPDVIKREVDDVVNYFVGTQGARSPQTMQRWADRLRAFQFSSKIAGNLTSPVWNAGQNYLTYAETSAKSFSKAWGDALKFYANKATGQAPDQNFVELTKRLGIDNELAAASTVSDIGLVPNELMNKFDKGLGKFNDIFGLPFRMVEANNRTIAAVAGYYDGIARGMTDEKAIVNGKKIMDKTQFTGGEVDLPRRFRSATGGVAGQFKTFTIKYAEYMKDNAMDAIKAALNDPRMSAQDKSDAIRKFVKFWGSQTAMGGVGAVPFIGDYLEEQLKDSPVEVHKGLGGLIGIDLTRQFGVGQLPVKVGKRPVEVLKELMYSLPGPTFNAAQDVIALKRGKYSGDGLDIKLSDLNKDLTWDEWERKLVRQLPAGVQAARIIEGMKIRLSSGKEGGPYGLTGPRKEAMSWAEATGFEKPSGALQSEVMQNALLTAIGLRGSDIEKESEIRSEEAEHTSIENEAKYNASKYYAAGKREQGDAILRRAEKQLKMKPNTLRPSAQSLKNARQRQSETALQRLRKQKAKKGVVVPTP